MEKVDVNKFEVPNKFKSIYAACIFIGLITFLVGLFSAQERIWHSYLLSFFYFLCLALGGLFFTSLQHVANAGWSVNIRRYAEALTAFLPVAAVLAAVLLAFGAKDLYGWMDPSVVKGDKLLEGKIAYLNTTFMVIRWIVFFGLWMLFTKLIVGRSLKQDTTGDSKLTLKNVPTSVAFLLVFALSFSLFSVDLIMSLDAHWFSTIFGIYCFAGLFQSTLAVLILIAIYLRKAGVSKKMVTLDHVHDLAKFLKAFTVFWAYIAFSQFLLIWYANLPEETIFYYHRSHGGWALLSLSLLLFKFIVPFICLLPRWAKRTPSHLVMVCILVLIMQYVDLYWLIYPNLTHESIPFSFYEIGIFLGFLGLFAWAVSRFLSNNEIIPIKDPRIEESINHHVTY